MSAVIYGSCLGCRAQLIRTAAGAFHELEGAQAVESEARRYSKRTHNRASREKEKDITGATTDKPQLPGQWMTAPSIYLPRATARSTFPFLAEAAAHVLHARSQHRRPEKRRKSSLVTTSVFSGNGQLKRAFATFPRHAVTLCHFEWFYTAEANAASPPVPGVCVRKCQRPSLRQHSAVCALLRPTQTVQNQSLFCARI